MPPRPAVPSRVDPLGAPWPGLIPLRPLGLLDIFAAATRLVRQRFAALCAVAFVGAVATAAATYGVLQLFPNRAEFYSDTWMDEAMAGRMSIPAVVLWPTLTAAMIGFLSTSFVAGMAAAFAATDALGPPASTAVALGRLRGRWLSLLVTTVIVGGLVTGGLLLLIVPGVFALALLALAAPAVAIERISPGAALRRSVLLSAGIRWRILGVVVLSLLIASVVEGIVSAIIPVSSTVGGAILSLIVAAAVSAITTPWVSSVIALLYIDARIRKENLAWSLVRASMKS